VIGIPDERGCKCYGAPCVSTAPSATGTVTGIGDRFLFKSIQRPVHLYKRE